MLSRTTYTAPGWCAASGCIRPLRSYNSPPWSLACPCSAARRPVLLRLDNSWVGRRGFCFHINQNGQLLPSLHQPDAPCAAVSPPWQTHAPSGLRAVGRGLIRAAPVCKGPRWAQLAVQALPAAAITVLKPPTLKPHAAQPGVLPRLSATVGSVQALPSLGPSAGVMADGL